jgi:hypothetical protein
MLRLFPLIKPSAARGDGDYGRRQWGSKARSSPPGSPTRPSGGLDAHRVFGGLISGGESTGTFSNAIQRISLPSGTAKIVGRLPTPLAHAMAATVDGRIYLLGGSAPGGPSAAIRRFDPATSRLSIAGRLPRPRTDAAVATIGRIVYLLGGISSGLWGARIRFSCRNAVFVDQPAQSISAPEVVWCR